MKNILNLFILLLFVTTQSIQAQNINPTKNKMYNKTFLVSTHLSSGESYQQKMKFSEDGNTLFIDVLDGSHKGLKDTVKVYMSMVSKNIWFVNWLASIETAAKGNTVSYVFNFDTQTVQGFFTINAPSPNVLRDVATAVGTFEILK